MPRSPAQLGKRYVQDQALDWGCAVDRSEDLNTWRAPGTTLALREAREE